MTTQTVGAAVAVRQKQDQVIDWIRAQQDEIAMVAASHVKPSAIVRVAHGALRRDPKLMAAAIANPQSLLYALLDAARLGHEPDTDDYYLVPFGSEVTGIEGYKGIIERMYRAGGVSSVVAQVVRKSDRYAPRGENTPPVHEYDDFASPDERGPMRGAYAYAVFPDGRCSQVIRMGRAEIMEHKAKSKGSDRADSPWKVWEPAMWKKTVLRALEPYVPTSTEYRTAAAARPVATIGPNDGSAPVPVTTRQVAQLEDAGIVDAEIVDEPDPTAAPGATASASTGAPAPAANGAASASQGDAGRRATSSADAAPQAASKAACDKLGKLVASLELGEPADVAALYEWLVAEPWSATRQQVTTVTSYLDDHLRAAQDDTAAASSAIWSQYRQANPQVADDGA